MADAAIRALLIDDESNPLNLLEELLNRTRKVVVQDKTNDPLAVTELVRRHQPDLLFLDVKMPARSGFEVLDELKNESLLNCEVVFTTAYDEFAIRAFEYAAFDYLLKPIDPERLSIMLERFFNKKSYTTASRAGRLTSVLDKLIFHSLSEYILIDPAEVVYIEADGNYSHFYLKDHSKETVTVNLAKIELQLNPKLFFRSSRSYIINTNFLKRILVKKHLCQLEANGTKYHCEIAQEKICFLAEYYK